MSLKGCWCALHNIIISFYTHFYVICMIFLVSNLLKCIVLFSFYTQMWVLGVPTMVATYKFSSVSDIFILIPVTRICKIDFVRI